MPGWKLSVRRPASKLTSVSSRLSLTGFGRWGLLLLAGLMALPGCLATRTATQPGQEVVDTYSFHVRDGRLKPVAGARIEILVEAGQPLKPTPLVTDAAGRAVLPVKALVRPQVEEKTRDKLLGFQSAISYRIEAPGFLPFWGRSQMEDAYQDFARPSFQDLMARRPENKNRPLAVSLVRVEDLFPPGALKDPLAEVVRSGLEDLWRLWLKSDPAQGLKPSPGGWLIERRPEGAYLKAVLASPRPLTGKSDKAVQARFEQEFIPLIKDLAWAYGSFMAGWDVTLVFNLSPGGDPHAAPEPLDLRLVFSEKLRQELLARPGGLNWLIAEAESLTLSGKPWDPLANLDLAGQRQRYYWDWLSPFFAPGPGEAPSEDEASPGLSQAAAGEALEIEISPSRPAAGAAPAR